MRIVYAGYRLILHVKLLVRKFFGEKKFFDHGSSPVKPLEPAPSKRSIGFLPLENDKPKGVKAMKAIKVGPRKKT